MKTAENNNAAGGPDLAAVTPLITAVVTALGAWKLFEPKLARIRAIRDEVGYLETGFILLYEIPQRILAFLSFAIVAILVVAFINSLIPSAISHYVPVKLARELTNPANIIWTVFLMGAIGAIIYWNILTQILLWVSCLLALSPLKGLRNRFGPRGYSIGWHQTASVCEGPDKGAPLLVRHVEIDRVAWDVLARLSSQADRPPNFAAEPSDLLPAEKANIALFGCIMESNFYANRWKSPDWAEFYQSLAEIQKKQPIFTPNELRKFGDGDAFFEVFRKRLESILIIKEQPAPPNQGLNAASDIAGAWALLNQKAQGNLLKIIPRWASLFGGKLFWRDRCLRSFPRLGGDGMRPQLIKLLVRWNVLPDVRSGIFVQPFAKRQAWLLLQEGALRALPEMKEVTFNGTGQVAIARIAARRVVRKVSDLIMAKGTTEARTVAAKVGDSAWNAEAAADFALWSWAGDALKAARDAHWDKGEWRWKFDEGRVIRL
jgi:hypothetical protein